MNDLDPLWLRSFVAIARHGSVTAAAREVNRTQSAVSTHLRQLESSLGAALATRSTRALALTAEGERFLPHAKRLLALQDEARAAVAGDTPARPWRIGISEYFLPGRLAELLDLLHANTQPARIELLWSSSQSLQALWAADEVDLAVVTSNTPLPGARLLRREVLSWVSAPRFSLARDEPAPLVLLGPGCPVREIALQALQRNGRPHHVRLSCSGSHGAVAAIRAGWGLGCLNESAIPGDLVRPRGWASPGRLSFYLLARPGLDATAAALRRFSAGPTLAR
ncbi:MAG: LysR family transcriptional regulator [Rhizobacter sp.]